MTPPRLTMLVFFLQALTFGSWLPRIPEMQTALGLDHATLALGLIGSPVGTLCTLPFTGWLTNRFGSRRIIQVGFVLFLIAIALPGWAINLPTFFLALMFVGISMSALEVGMNVMADEVEKHSGQLIMTTSHGFWSLGVMVGSLAAAGFAALHIPPGLSQFIFAAALLIPVQLVARRLPDYHDVASQQASHGRLSLPHAALLGICIFVLGVSLTEGAAADWSAVYMRDIFAVPVAAAGLAYTMFALMVTAGRFLGDRARARFGAMMLGRCAALLGAAGGLVVVFAPSPEIAIAGFGLMGIGASVGFPLGVTAAAQAPGRSPASNVATLTFIALTGFLAGPPVIGGIAQALDLRYGLAILIPALLASAALASLLRSRKKPLQHPVEAPVI